MIPVDQTRFAIDVPLAEAPGNCWAACIASILELPITELPDEADDWKPGMSHRESWRLYSPRMSRWLEARGLSLLEVPIDGSTFSGTALPLCILSGPSPRNPEFLHAVVGRGENIIHDPHPSRAGLLKIDGKGWYCELFIAVDPSKSLGKTPIARGKCL